MVEAEATMRVGTAAVAAGAMVVATVAATPRRVVRANNSIPFEDERGTGGWAKVRKDYYDTEKKRKSFKPCAVDHKRRDMRILLRQSRVA